jgi:hypothetical protein
MLPAFGLPETRNLTVIFQAKGEKVSYSRSLTKVGTNSIPLHQIAGGTLEDSAVEIEG